MSKVKSKVKAFVISISEAFIIPYTIGILAGWKALANPITGKPSLTNFPTCLLGNVERSFIVTYLVGGQKKVVKADNWAPARILATGVFDRSLSRQMMGKYSRGQFKSVASATREFWLVLSYYIACITRATLPSPSKRSVSTTIMGEFVDYWLQTYNINVESVTVKGTHGLTLTHSPASLDAMRSLFRLNAENLKQEWPARVTRANQDDGILI